MSSIYTSMHRHARTHTNDRNAGGNNGNCTDKRVIHVIPPKVSSNYRFPYQLDTLNIPSKNSAVAREHCCFLIQELGSNFPARALMNSCVLEIFISQENAYKCRCKAAGCSRNVFSFALRNFNNQASVASIQCSFRDFKSGIYFASLLADRLNWFGLGCNSEHIVSVTTSQSNATSV